MTAFTNLNPGSAANDGTGTKLRAGAQAINVNNVLTANLTENNRYSSGKTNYFNGDVELNTMPDFQQIGTVKLGRNDEGERYHLLEFYNDNAPATNYVKIRVHDGTLGSTVSVIEAYGDGAVKMPLVKSGATQVAAGAAATEVWKTAGHATLPDNVLMIGV